jgi:hypothetical protein|nr:DUF4148 domain-containing protein [Paraburkholderia sp. BL8N3]
MMKMSTLLAICTLGALPALAHAQTPPDPSAAPVRMAPAPTNTAMSPEPGQTQGPLTRAQVRADLARARADGTIPPFGNPDPYGPGRWGPGTPPRYPSN